MNKCFAQRVAAFLWHTLVLVVVLLATYVSIGRYLMSGVSQWQQGLLAEINARVPFVLRAEQVQGHWRSFSPRVSFSGLRIESFSENLPPVELTGGQVTLNLWASLLSRTLQFSSLSLDGLTVRAVLTDQGKLEFPGLPKGEGELRDWLWKFLDNVEQLRLQDNTLQLQLPDGEQRAFDLELTFQHKVNDWRLVGELESPEGQFSASSIGKGKGVFGEPESFSGDFYTRLNYSDLSGALDLLPQDWRAHIGALKGEAEIQAWLSWRRGRPELALQVAADKLKLNGTKDSYWHLPADAVTFNMELFQQENRWRGAISELAIRQKETTVGFPRFELSSLGQQLQLHAENVELAPLAALITELGVLSEAGVDAIGKLAPRGRLNTVYYRVEDLAEPGRDWQLKANFDSLGLLSWKGAPGAENAAGFLSLTQDGGVVRIDSSDSSLQLPKVYHSALEYESVVGTLDIAFYPGLIELSSNVIEARDGGKDARVVFGMNIPLPMRDSKIGVEMDLLVGAVELPAEVRHKYIPYKLKQPLQDWLSSSILAGQVHEGGFVWRGSLRKKSAPLRTVQMFFDTLGGELRYDSRWPTLTEFDGLVMIDDAMVSVWADRARILDSEVTHLSAESFRGSDRRFYLDVESSLEGPAADGLAVVNNSPLNGRVNGAFANWQAEGTLTTELALRLGLADPEKPLDIDLKTDLSVDLLDITPAALAITDLRGQLFYQLHNGFRSEGLTGTFWGEKLDIQVSEQPPIDPQPVAGGRSLTIDLAGDVKVDNLRDWLRADILHFVEGEALVDGKITIEQSLPVLNLASDLRGVSAAGLPAPFGKLAEETRPLNVRIPLGSSDAVCNLEAGEDIAAKIVLADYRPTGISLGLGTTAPATTAGQLRVTGSLSTLDVAHWRDFLGRYSALEDADVGAEAEAESDDKLMVKVEGLVVDEMLTAGREFHGLVLDLVQQPDQWRVVLETGWVKGEARVAPDFGSISAAVDYLDLGGIQELKLGDIESTESPEIDIPDLEIKIAELAKGDLSLGELAFRAVSTPEGIAVRDIHGQYAGLRIDPQTPARLDWLSREGGPRTRFEGGFTFSDLGQVLQTLGYQEVVQTREGQFSITLDWPGTPMRPKLKGGNGEFNFSLGEGQFLNAPAGATGTLQVLGILNLAQFVRMLSLESSGSFNDGVPFYGVEGEVVLADNLIRITEAEIDGRNGRFGFTGSVDVVSEEMDAELAVTLPVANNIPWVAALVGGLPAAAGAFIVSKLFENQMDRFASAVYRVQGPWYKPSTTFTRIFDNETRKDLTPEDFELAAEDVTSGSVPPSTMEGEPEQPAATGEQPQAPEKL